MSVLHFAYVSLHTKKNVVACSLNISRGLQRKYSTGKKKYAVSVTSKLRTYRLISSGVQITFSLYFAVKFELQSFGPSIVRIRSIETANFLAINSKGVLQTKVSKLLAGKLADWEQLEAVCMILAS